MTATKAIRRTTIAVLATVIASLCCTSHAISADGQSASAADTQGRYSSVSQTDGLMILAPDGKPVMRYMPKKPAKSGLTAPSACCFHPICTPSGEVITAFAPADHPHHRGVFLAWYTMKGAKEADFWGWGEFSPVENRLIENRRLELVAADTDHAELKAQNEWVAEGEVMIDEEVQASVRRRGCANVVDLTYRLTATSKTVIPQAAFGGFNFRGRKEGKVTFTDPKGEVNLPWAHYLKPETDWPAADWYDFTITLDDGRSLGMTVMDHPENPPSGWHVLADLCMVNPCIAAPGPFTLEKGEPLVLRYRLVAHDGPAPVELLDKLTTEWRGK